jgi:hypothetical protein
MNNQVVDAVCGMQVDPAKRAGPYTKARRTTSAASLSREIQKRSGQLYNSREPEAGTGEKQSSTTGRGGCSLIHVPDASRDSAES